MSASELSLKKGRFYYFEPPLLRESRGWNRIEFQLRFSRTSYETLTDDRGRISVLFYEGDDEKVPRYCEQAERSGGR